VESGPEIGWCCIVERAVEARRWTPPPVCQLFAEVSKGAGPAGVGDSSHNLPWKLSLAQSASGTRLHVDQMIKPPPTRSFQQSLEPSISSFPTTFRSASKVRLTRLRSATRGPVYVGDWAFGRHSHLDRRRRDGHAPRRPWAERKVQMLLEQQWLSGMQFC
jgi:hypothetical protein